MNNRNGALSFDAYIGDTDFNRTIQSMNKKLEGLTNKTLLESRKMESAFSNMGRLAAGAFAGFGLAQLPGELIRVRGQFQQLETSFKTMLGSKALADKLMADVVKFAATTPFDLAGVAGATKQLLAYGFASEEVLTTLRRLGDISSGLNIPLNELTEIYGKARVGGRLYAEDFNKFIDRGIPLIQLLAQQFKVADSEVKGLVESGKVGFEQVEIAIKKLTDTGGMFAGLTQENAKSLTGLYSNFEDTISQAFNKIGQEQEGLLADSIRFGTAVVENYEPIIDSLKVIVAAYGAYRAAIILTAAAQSSSIILAEVQAFIALAKSIRTAADAQALLNLAVRANPYVIAATAIAGLITAYAVFGDEASEAEKLQNRMNEAMQKAEDAAASEQAKIQVLTAQIQDETKSRDERNKKLKELINISPQHLNALTLENFATAEGTKLIGDYIEAKKKQIELKEIEAELEKSITNQNKARRGENDLSFWDRLSLSAAASAGDMDYSKSSASERKRLNDQIVKDEDAVQAKLRERVKALSGVDAATTKSAENTSKAVRKTVADYNEEIKALKDKQEKSGTRAEFLAIDKQIKALEASRDRITGGSGRSKAKDEKSAKDEKEVRVKTYAEELEEKKRMYELYERWILNYGKSAADKQFASLISKNKDYLAYVNHEIERLEYIRDAGYMGGLSTQDKFDLDSLLSERTALTGGKSPIDQFKDQLDAARDSSESLTDELIKVKAIQAELDPNDNSANGIAKRQAAAEREVEIIKERKYLLQDFLTSVAGSEQRQTAIQKKYQDMREALDKDSNDKKSAGYIKALERIDKAEKEEIKEDKEDANRKSKEYKAFMKIVEKNYQDLKEIDVKNAREEFKRLTEKLDKNSDEYKVYYANLRKIEEDAARKRIETITNITVAVGQVAGIMSGMDGEIGAVGSTIANVASQVGSIVSSLGNVKKNAQGKFDISSVTTLVGIITTAIGLLINGIKKMKEFEKEYFARLKDLENSYALAQNDKIGSQFSKNPFIADYNGMIQAGVKQYQDATSKYQQAIDKLDQGRVQVGYKSGFFNNRKVFADLLEFYPDLVDAAGNVNKELAQSLLSSDQLDDKTKVLVQNAIDWADQLEKANDQIMDTVVGLTGVIAGDLTDAMVNAFKAGENGAEAMNRALGNIIETMVKQTVLMEIFRPIMDEFAQGVKDSFAAGGDGSIIDDLTKLGSKLPGAASLGEEIMKSMQEYGKLHGIPIFEQTTGGSGSGSVASMTDNVKGATEETVSILVGQFNAVRIYSAQTAFDVRNSLLILTQIAQNTSYNRILVDVSAKLDRLIDQGGNSSLRGSGLGNL